MLNTTKTIIRSAMSKEPSKKTDPKRTFDIRNYLRPDAVEDLQTYERFGEMIDYFHPIKPNKLNKLLINKAYEEWFVPKIKKGANK